MVSIQLLFLFNTDARRNGSREKCFNTASVLIQLLELAEAILVPRFNTASVLIQHNAASSAYAPAAGFNTASVLIQRLNNYKEWGLW